MLMFAMGSITMPSLIIFFSGYGSGFASTQIAKSHL
ncbi:Uncharacterised protein [Enterobacter cloacae]|nr:Uncharacterised protein [Enterobacter cloacae]